MKIFSLQTKKHLLGWSLFLAIILAYLLQVRDVVRIYNCFDVEECEQILSHQKFQDLYNIFIFLIGWVVFFILLYLIPRFRKRNT